MARAKTQSGIWTCQEGEDASTRIAQPNEFAKEATGLADGARAEAMKETSSRY